MQATRNEENWSAAEDHDVYKTLNGKKLSSSWCIFTYIHKCRIYPLVIKPSFEESPFWRTLDHRIEIIINHLFLWAVASSSRQHARSGMAKVALLCCGAQLRRAAASWRWPNCLTDAIIFQNGGTWNFPGTNAWSILHHFTIFYIRILP